MALEIPTRIQRTFIEHAGIYRDVEVEDRPYRVLERRYIERKGCYEDIEQPLTDTEILEAGGIKRFFNDDGTRREGSWPYDPSVKPAPKKKKAKRKSSK